MTNLIQRALANPNWTDLSSPPTGAIREADICHDGTFYYLFNTGSYDPPYISIRKATSIEGLMEAEPFNVHGAVSEWGVRYPSVVYRNGVVYLWATGADAQTAHFVANTPLTPTTQWTRLTTNAFGYGTPSGANLLVDAAVRLHPDGYWYAIGFVNMLNAPLTLLRGSSHDAGSWTNLGNVFKGGVPLWASEARADPNLIFLPDGSAYATFTGKMADSPLLHQGIVELSLLQGEAGAKGCAVQLFTPPEMPLSDLTYLVVEGESERIFGFTNDGAESGEPQEGEWHWGCLVLAGA